MTITALDIITDAFLETGIIAGSETPAADEAAFGLRLLNRMLDQWTARKLNIYSVNFTLYTLTPTLQPHTIGKTGNVPAPTFSTTGERPVKIESATLVLNTGSQAVDVPLSLRDDAWWADQRVKALSTSVPTDLYYSPDWPNGKIYLWPIPTIAYGLRLEFWTTLNELATLATAFSLPPGYRDAIVYSLAERLYVPFGHPVNPMTVSLALKARSTIQSPNSKAPRLSTRDYGIPDSGFPRNRPNFNWLTRGIAGRER